MTGFESVKNRKLRWKPDQANFPREHVISTKNPAAFPAQAFQCRPQQHDHFSPEIHHVRGKATDWLKWYCQAMKFVRDETSNSSNESLSSHFHWFAVLQSHSGKPNKETALNWHYYSTDLSVTQIYSTSQQYIVNRRTLFSIHVVSKHPARCQTCPIVGRMYESSLNSINSEIERGFWNETREIRRWMVYI